MTFGSNSKVFSAYLHDIVSNTTAMDIGIGGDATFNVQLLNDTTTPSQTAAAASTAYNTGVWTTTNTLTDTGTSAPAGWPTVGRPLTFSVATRLTDNTATTLKWDADDTVSANAVTTLASTYGCMVYDDTIATPVAKQGVCYLSFGGPNAVTLGTFTVVWSASGILSIAM